METLNREQERFRESLREIVSKTSSPEVILNEPTVQVVVGKIEELKAENASLKVQLSNLRTLLEEKERLIATRKTEKIQLINHEIAEKIDESNIFEEFFKLKKELDAKNKCIEAVNSQISQSEQSFCDYFDMSEEPKLKFMRENVALLLREKENLQGTLEDALKQKEEAFKELQQNINERNEAFKSKEESENKVASLEEKVTNLLENLTQIEVLKQQLTMVEQKNTDLTATIANLKAEIEKRELTLKQTEDKLSIAEEELNKLENETRPLNEEEKHKFELSIKAKYFNNHFGILLKAKKVIKMLQMAEIKWEAKATMLEKKVNTDSSLFKENAALKAEITKLTCQVESLREQASISEEEPIQMNNETVKTYFNKLLTSLKKSRNLIRFLSTENKQLKESKSKEEELIIQLKDMENQKNAVSTDLNRKINVLSMEKAIFKGTVAGFATEEDQSNADLKELTNTMVKAMKVIKGLKQALTNVS